MAEVAANSLFRFSAKVSPGPDCDMPSNLRGSKVSADVEWTRSNNDPTKTITPNIASVLIRSEIT